jgi:hypothetical protein
MVAAEFVHSCRGIAEKVKYTREAESSLED